MTSQEAMERAAEANTQAQRAMFHHGLAMQAFSVAIARWDWTLAEKEHRAALDHLDAYMNALMSCQRIAQEMAR